MASSNDTSYLGNPLLKKSGTPHNYTPEEIQEYIKCSKSIEYFTENYVKIIHVDHGLIPLKLFKFQKKILKTIEKNRFTIAKLPRQSGKSTTIIAFFLHYILFNEDVNVAILANKGETARELLGRLQLAYENLPIFLQQGVKIWNKGDIHLENGSKIVAASTSSNAIRGRTYNCILLDEFAFVPRHVADEFFSSVYPTITSGTTTKMIIVSTPYGMNHFYKLWMDAINEKNNYIPIEANWNEVPGRNEAWRYETIKNIGQERWDQEFNCVSGETEIVINNSKKLTIKELYDDIHSLYNNEK